MLWIVAASFGAEKRHNFAVLLSPPFTRPRGYPPFRGADMGGTYRDLRVWRSAMELTSNVYRGTRKFPADEMYGLSSQLRRAAVSVPSNIAEGKGRSSDKELLQFLSHARGSIYEVQTQLEIAVSLEYLSNEDRKRLREEADDVARMLNGMISEFRKKTTPAGT
jgi:four helix bundle protein